ncbi:MAG: tRNA (adenosine(37)-N6)-dimethylallyltransferase MiaA [Chitinophagaceae bacterium]|nr:tRNA (adenosine(37)-N6)-dimethylallyltransferase MiaA [Chitinophagaceae bacterium]HQV05421.1 tRNA (adenosine(37)-N6)-dimethylallyltransferase MiaA [Chitinophagaceae bacterium]
MEERKKNKTVILIVGPTAVGKTAVAIQLAQQFHTEIISADSRQCFKELNIGVARPSKEELAMVRHHFIASHSIRDDVTAVSFEQFALQKVTNLFSNYQQVIMVGGTGLYIKAFCEGLDAIPETEPLLRKKIIAKYDKQGMEWLCNELKEKDPLFFQQGEMQNPQRMIRALEVVETTGQSILYFHQKQSVKRNFSIIKLGLNLPREELKNRIDARVDAMMNEGLLDEVRALKPYQNLNALQTVGYKELFAYLDNKMSLDEAIERIKISTRQYAKRQLTWFRKDKEIRWFHPEQIKEMLAYISR